MDSETTKWLGGYVRSGKRGPTYVIERWIDGRRYHVSTKCRTLRAAMRQLEAFEADPANYKPGRDRAGAAAPDQVCITAELVLEYRGWMLGRNTPTTRAHADNHVRRLREWMEFYRGRDIRTVPLREISAHLKGKRNLLFRIQSLKAFCGWLRREKFLLTRAEDPTIDLRQPPPRATKDAREVAIQPERIMAVLPFLPEQTRDVMILRLGTGWHYSEVARFAQRGEIRRTPGKFVHLMGADGAERVPLLAVLHTPHKIGVTTKTPVLYEEHLEAAERIRARGRVQSYYTLNRHVTEACERAGVERFLNWHIRHSVVSYAAESGADLEQASVFVDHVNIDTTRKHYRQIALPKKAVPVLRVVDGGKKSSA